MSDQGSTHRVQIIIALIGLVGILATGIFGVLPHFLNGNANGMSEAGSSEEEQENKKKIAGAIKDSVELERLTRKKEIERLDSILKAKAVEEAKPVIGQYYQGGTVYTFDDNGEHGKVYHLVPERMLWRDAELHCSRLKIEEFDDWEMPGLEEIKDLYRKGHLDRHKFDYWSRDGKSGHHWTLREWLGQEQIVPGLSAGTGPDKRNSVVAIRRF